MKFILFTLNDTNKNLINRIELDDEHYINEVSLSKIKLEQMEKSSPKLLQKIRKSIWDKNIEKKIIKALSCYDKKWYYILDKNIANAKYITNKAESLLGYKLGFTSELDSNIFKYVDEYVKNKTLKKHELKMLLVANYNKTLNFTLLENLIKEYKTVNIYLKEKASTYTQKRIKQINKSEGTTIEIIKKERKQFSEYNVIYFMDDEKKNYPRFRINKESLVIDINCARKDKFNSNIIFVNEYIEKNNVFKNNIELLLNKYNYLEVAQVIRKITNVIDKS